MSRPFYTLVYLAAVLILFVLSLFIPADKGAVADLKLADSAKATLDYLTEVVKFVGTLNTALFGACGALAIKGREWSVRWNEGDGYFIVLALVAGAVSYYGSYLAHTAILEMVYMGTIDPWSPRLLWALNIAYYGLLCGVLLIGLVFTRLL